MDDSSPQTIYIIAGPNGAGKTMFANSFLPTFAKCREFLNADLIAAGLSPYNPESQAFRASELLLQRIDELVESHSSFSFETTLAARSYRNSILNWKARGYQVFLVYLWLPSAGVAVERVATRVKEGGHFIPEEVIRRRYRRGLDNLFELYQPVVSTVQIRDGSRLPPALVWEKDQDAERVLNYNRWIDIQNSRTVNDDQP